ncbi:SGNH/GDSL hydrolase family protein [Williamsia herbipolensis]|uniref:SGNH/GDSL hydrolase family protein n=1 Tax=Williamsia herbipolensis TaxID=1603258 RepID=UPI0005F866A4|nr:SGNH/GDSL hydrolase family protein [Williamsia herbipolensis]
MGPGTRRRWLRTAASLTAIVGVAALVATAVGWSTSDSTTDDEAMSPMPRSVTAEGPLRYVALGSSYAAGPDVGDLIDARCLRSRDDYPHRVAADWRADLTDVTCSGSTIPDILDRAQPGRASEPQIDAVHPDTELVTITTGGNDLRYIGRLTEISCTNALAEPVKLDGKRCRPGRPAPPPTPGDYDRLRASMIRLVDAVRARAPRAVIMIVDYLPVLDAQATTCPVIPLDPLQARQTADTFAALTATTRAAAEASGATLVNAAAAGADHTACSASPWVYGFRLPLPYHPNAEGREAMASLVLDALETSGLRRATMPS